jgi:hypothetical protein
MRGVTSGIVVVVVGGTVVVGTIVVVVGGTVVEVVVDSTTGTDDKSVAPCAESEAHAEAGLMILQQLGYGATWTFHQSTH